MQGEIGCVPQMMHMRHNTPTRAIDKDRHDARVMYAVASPACYDEQVRDVAVLHTVRPWQAHAVIQKVHVCASQEQRVSGVLTIAQAMPSLCDSERVLGLRKTARRMCLGGRWRQDGHTLYHLECDNI